MVCACRARVMCGANGPGSTGRPHACASAARALCSASSGGLHSARRIRMAFSARPKKSTGPRRDGRRGHLGDMPGQNGLRVGEAFGRNFTQKRQRDVIIGRDAISAGHPRFGSAGGEGGFRADVVGERKTVKQTHDQHLKKESRDYCNGFSLAAQVCYNQNRMRKRGDKRLDANGRCLSAGGQPDDDEESV